MKILGQSDRKIIKPIVRKFVMQAEIHQNVC